MSRNYYRDLEIVPIIGDGNCLFRAVSFCMYGTQNFHQDVRAAVVQNVIQKWSFYENFLEGVDRTEYEKFMGQNGEYGGEVELHSIADVNPDCKFTIYVKADN